MDLSKIYNRARLDDRQISELLGIAHGLIADGHVNQAEAEYLQKWLVSNCSSNSNPILNNLLTRVNEYLRDNTLDEEESNQLFHTLESFAGGDFEIGEIQKSSLHFFDNPPPDIVFKDKLFCFTGTFAFGSRKACEEAVCCLGATSGNLVKNTDYLVIGIYATDSWIHSAYGRKIEKAMQMKQNGALIKILGEQHWLSFLPRE